MNIEELKLLAEAANELDPGEWTAGRDQWYGCVLTRATLFGRDISLCVADCTSLEAAALQNAAYIAAANPAAILELIRQRDELLSMLRDAGCLLDMLRTGDDGEKYDYVESRHNSMMLVADVVSDAAQAIANAEKQS